MRIRNVLVTGGAGFAGSALALMVRKHYPRARVTTLDNLMRRGSALNLPRLEAAGVRFLHGDLRQPADLEAAGPFDLLIDCAAEPSVQAGADGSPRQVIDINLAGSINAFEAARRHGAGILFLSTSRVYPVDPLTRLAYRETALRFELEDSQPVPGASALGISEAFPLAGPRSFYGSTKLACELLLQEYARTCGLRVLINRCGVLAGPWQMGRADQGVVTLWVARHLYGRPLDYIGYGGTGKQVRDVLHIEDLADLVALQLRRPKAWDGRAYNVGGGRDGSVSLRELTTLCRRVTRRRVMIGARPESHAMDVPVYLSDSRRVSADFDWSPRRRLEAIVTDIAAWINRHRDALEPVLAG